jgi:hypothetical protein
METSDWIGFAGVSILLFAFFLNLTNKIKKEELPYILLNIVGAGIACWASAMIHYLPFVVLEGCWTLVSLYGLIGYFKTKNNSF